MSDNNKDDYRVLDEGSPPFVLGGRKWMIFKVHDVKQGQDIKAALGVNEVSAAGGLKPGDVFEAAKGNIADPRAANVMRQSYADVVLESVSVVAPWPVSNNLLDPAWAMGGYLELKAG